MPKKKKPLVLSKLELAKKDTRALLDYLKKLRHCEESFESSDMIENPDLTDNSTIYFKQTDKWKKAYSDVKSILDQRENLS